METRQKKLERVIKLIMSIGFFGAALLWERVGRLVGKKARRHGVILYYHAVPAEHRSLFARQMDILTRLTEPVKLDVHSALDEGVRYSAVTFDDGLQSILENAIPELRKRNIPATLFITSGSLGRAPEWWPELSQDESNDSVVSAEQLQQLPKDLVTVGSHTITHPMLPYLSEQEAKRELLGSRIELEQLLKCKITLFSFPFGAFNNDLVQWAREAGYERVFTSQPTLAFPNSKQFVTGRVPADPTDLPLEFRLKLLGAYRWLPYAIIFKRWILSNGLVRDIRRQVVRRATTAKV